MPGKAKKSGRKRSVVSTRKAPVYSQEVKQIAKRTGHTRRDVALALKQARTQEERARQVRAEIARDNFRATKADRGKVVFVGVKGQRDAGARGRRGYAVYVTKGGHKRLVYSRDKEGKRQAPTAKKLKSLDLPFSRMLHKKVAEFIDRRQARTGAGQAVTKRAGGTKATAKQKSLRMNRGSRTVEKLARDVRAALGGQASQRNMNVRAEVLFRRRDGRKRRVEVAVPISRPDHIAIKKGGIRNFVMQKLYAHLARALAFEGYVTAGSANHIRRLAGNKGQEQADWTDKNGDPWIGNDMEIVTVERVHWEIDQLE